MGKEGGGGKERKQGVKIVNKERKIEMEDAFHEIGEGGG